MLHIRAYLQTQLKLFHSSTVYEDGFACRPESLSTWESDQTSLKEARKNLAATRRKAGSSLQLSLSLSKSTLGGIPNGSLLPHNSPLHRVWNNGHGSALYVQRGAIWDSANNMVKRRASRAPARTAERTSLQYELLPRPENKLSSKSNIKAANKHQMHSYARNTAFQLSI